MDVFSGYHQIPLSTEDQEKAAFVTDQELHYYMVMPFTLKNIGVTDQCLVNKIF